MTVPETDSGRTVRRPRPRAAPATILAVATCVALSGLFGFALNLGGGTPPAVGSLTLASGTGYPPVAWGQSMIYDAAEGYVLMLHNTWTYLDGEWTELDPSPEPSVGSWYCLAYDPVAGYTVLFGGGAGGGFMNGIGFAGHPLNATWTYASGKWTNVTSDVGTMPALKYPACAYDPQFDGGAVIVFAGANSSYYDSAAGSWLMNDTDQTYAYVPGSTPGSFDWVHLHPTVSPPARFGAGMAYDSSSEQLVLYGGAQDGTSTANGSCTPAVCPHLHDTWLFTGDLSSNTWSPVATGATPPGSVFTDLAYDAADGYLVDFGGQDNGYKSANATLNETWTFDGTSWQNLTPSLALSPPTRFGAAMTFDPATESVLMFSGLSGTLTGSSLRDDFWGFSGGAWTLLGGPPNSVKVHEVGLASGTRWSVTVSESTYSSTGSTIRFSEPDGTFEYTVNVTGSGDFYGSFVADDAVVNVDLTFHRVTFSESGLASGTAWSVTVNSAIQSSSGSKINFYLPNGSYGYRVGLVPGEHAADTGSIVVAGAALTVKVAFSKTTYLVEFTETGLAKGTAWSVTLAGTLKSSTTSSLTFKGIANGTYAYSIGAVAGYSLTGSPTGTVTVSGGGTGTIAVTVTTSWTPS